MIVKINKNISLQSHHTFALEVFAECFVHVQTEQDLVQLFENEKIVDPVFILGAGSNVLFNGDFKGTVLKIDIKGIEKVYESGKTVLVSAAAGEDWDEFVAYCTAQGWYGLENLSLIPGTVGAAPVQNVGAFGVEAGNLINKLRVFNTETGDFEEFSGADCRFGYRDSRFKHDWAGKYVVARVFFRLKTTPDVNLDYEGLRNVFDSNSLPSPVQVREAVIKIRESRLPDVKKIGNAGSFFKNPVVSNDVFEQIREKYPEVVHFPVDETSVKLAAAWLIEHAGWKGKRHGNAGVHEKQALVIVNYGGAKPHEIIELSQMIEDSIESMFGVRLEREVIVV